MLRLRLSSSFTRRVLPIMGGYLAAAWGVLQFASWVSERYVFTPRLVDAVSIALLLFMPGVLFFAWKSRDQNSGDDYVEPDPASLAVLPFANRSSPEDGYLSDGISEEILITLARVDGLRVVARTSSFAFRDEKLDVRAIGRALQVRNLLEGSVQRAGSRLRITTQLVDARDGFQRWAGRWDAEMKDVFAIEDTIAGNVARELTAQLKQKPLCEVQPVPRANVRAYEQYLRGRQFYAQTRKKSLGFARDMFRHAIELDPSYAAAHAALADSITLERMYYHACDADLDEADRATMRALALEPSSADAHAARAGVLCQRREFEEAEREFKLALELNPCMFEAWYFYARMCFQLGRLNEAATLFSTALEVREDYQAAFFAAQTHEALGNSDVAKDAYARALDVVERYMELNPDDARAATIRSTALCRLGRTPEGLDWAARAVDIDSEDAGVRYNVACTFAVSGERERAIDYLEDAVRVGFGNREWLSRDPDLASLRGDERFESLLKGI